jgi:hypothetical protein
MKQAILCLCVVSPGLAWADVQGSRFFIGTSAFMLYNLNQSTDYPPHFYQLNLGYQLTPKDVLSVEFITWRYYAPLAILDSDSNEEENFPGYVKVVGPALAYQRFIAGGFYTALHSAFFQQSFYNDADEKNGSGRQLFLTFRLGYHLSFYSDKLFLEPSVAMTHWPINTGLPEDFQAREDKWRKYQFEPGLHVGYVF